jgi:hypothetical protein
VTKAEVDRYYDRMLEPDELRKAGHTERALQVALELVGLVPALVAETVALYGRFDITSIPPIETGCMLAAVLGDAPALGRIASVVSSLPELAPWRDVVRRGQEDAEIVGSVRLYVAANPGALQSGLGKALGRDGRAVSRLVGYMYEAGQVRRDKSGRTYALFLAV